MYIYMYACIVRCCQKNKANRHIHSANGKKESASKSVNTTTQSGIKRRIFTYLCGYFTLMLLGFMVR